MSQADLDYLKSYAGVTAAPAGGDGGSGQFALSYDDLEDARTNAPTPMSSYQQALLDRADEKDRAAREERAQREAQREQDRTDRREAQATNAQRRRQATLTNRALSALDVAHAQAQRLGSLPTPGGVGALLLGLLGLVSLTVPVNGSSTRFNLLWLTLTGKTKLPSAGAVSGSAGGSAASGVAGAAASAGAGLQQGVAGVAAKAGGLLGAGRGAAAGSNQDAVNRAAASAGSSIAANALPTATPGPYQLGVPSGNGAIPPQLSSSTF